MNAGANGWPGTAGKPAGPMSIMSNAGRGGKRDSICALAPPGARREEVARQASVSEQLQAVTVRKYAISAGLVTAEVPTLGQAA